MQNVNKTAAYKETVFNYLCDALDDFEEYGVPDTQEERAKIIASRFESEHNYGANIRRYPNLQERIADWLAGLPLNIDHYYSDILRIHSDWAGCNFTDKQAEKLQDEWFNFLAMKLIQLWRRHNIAIANASA